MTVPSQGHYGFHSFPVDDWFCLFIVYTYEFWLSLCKNARSSVILLLPLFVTRVTGLLTVVDQSLLTLPVHIGSSTIFIGVRVAQSYVFYEVFCRSLFVLLSLLFRSLYYLSSDFLFWLPLWYLQTLLTYCIINYRG